jgi:putative DNA primase/helicase
VAGDLALAGVGGLNPPNAVIAATDDYLEAEDSIQTWIGQDTSANLFTSWKNWAENASKFVGSSKAFSEKLQSHGYKKITIGHEKLKGYQGVKVDIKVSSWESR